MPSNLTDDIFFFLYLFHNEAQKGFIYFSKKLVQLYFLSFHPWQSGTQAQMLALDCFIKAAAQRKLYLKSMSITWATSLLNKTGMLMTMMSVEISALLPVLPVKQCFSPPSFWIRSTWIIPLQIHTQFMNSKPYIFKKEVTVIVLLVSLN